MKRISVIGNAAGGKSTLTRNLARTMDLPRFEVDAFQWADDWTALPQDVYWASHEAIVTQDRWLLDGFGSWPSVERRFERAEAIILIDLPLWVHFWLAAERQNDWHRGNSGDKPAGHKAPPDTKALFEMIWRVDRDAMPRLREMAKAAEADGKAVFHLQSLEAVSDLQMHGLETPHP